MLRGLAPNKTGIPTPTPISLLISLVEEKVYFSPFTGLEAPWFHKGEFVLLPIREIESAIVSSLRETPRLVISAPTGSGKTTQVCQIVLDHGLIAPEQQLLVLQPRRVAARSVARRVAMERGGELGGEVGFQVRFEDQIGPSTRIRFITEGILLRLLETDPVLSSVGGILFDEFHERSLHADVALALARRLQAGGRGDLKIVVMSATLEVEPISAFLDQAPVLEASGRSYPVALHYLQRLSRERMPELAAEMLQRAIAQELPGDVLIFMPGKGEIRQTMEAISGLRLSEPLSVLPLHGDLSSEEQDRVFAAEPVRKVVVATNVAETSLTIEGIRIVIDSGQARVDRFDAERGIQGLFLENISKASTIQRAGRAGRTAPGVCFRLWTESGQLDRPDHPTPEIRRCDLAEMVLLLHGLGIEAPSHLPMLDAPAPEAIEASERLLATLGALESGVITPIGRKMLKLPLHPRYSRMLIEASQRGCLGYVTLLAAAVSGKGLLLHTRDSTVLRRRSEEWGETESDLFWLVKAFLFAQGSGFDVDACRALGIHAGAARMVPPTVQQIADLCRAAGLGDSRDHEQPEEEEVLKCILAGFPDQVAVRRAPGLSVFDLTEGRSGVLAEEAQVKNAVLVVAAEIRSVPSRQRHETEKTILQWVSRCAPEWIAELFADRIERAIEHRAGSATAKVRAEEVDRFEGLVIRRRPVSTDDSAAQGRALAALALQERRKLRQWTQDVEQLIERLNLVGSRFPDTNLAMPEARLLEVLGAALSGYESLKQARDLPVKKVILGGLTEDELAFLEWLAPAKMLLPNGKTLVCHYMNPKTVVEATIRVNELFQVHEHPTILDGEEPVLLHLKEPRGKPLEDTTDLAAFWTQRYPVLRGRLYQLYKDVPWP